MDFISELAKQGFGFFLAAGELIAIIFLYNQGRKKESENLDKILELSERRVKDLQEARNAYLQSIEGLKTVAETTLTIVQNLQNLANDGRK